jgi:preprotein translocase subunit SecG
MRTTALLATALLAIAMILVFATAASAGRDRAVCQPCDYKPDWKIDGTSCG